MSSNNEQYEEVLGFLKDTRTEVQAAAAEAVLGLTEENSFVEYCRTCPRLVARPMLRIIEKDPLEKSTDEARENALKCLVNLAGTPAVQSELIELRAPSRCIEVLRELWLNGNNSHVHWFTMLLANLSTEEKGQAAFALNIKDLMFVLTLYTGEVQPKPKDDIADRLLWAGKVLHNVCASKAGRAVIVTEVPGLRLLAKDLNAPSRRHRRGDIMSIFKNLCNDKECHDVVIQSGFYLRMACFLYPDGEPEERRRQLPEPVLEEMQGFTSDIAVRRLGAESLYSLAGSKDGRVFLKEGGCYELLRAWHLKETDEQTIKLIVDTVPLVHLSEEELEQGLTMVPASQEGLDLSAVPAPSSSASEPLPEIGEESVLYPPASSHAFSAPDSTPSSETKAERLARAEALAKPDGGSAKATAGGAGYAKGTSVPVAAKAREDDDGKEEEKMEIEGLFDDISSDDEKDKK
jgi:hypothetical protein